MQSFVSFQYHVMLALYKEIGSFLSECYQNSHGIICSLKIWYDLPMKLSGCGHFLECSSFNFFLKVFFVN